MQLVQRAHMLVENGYPIPLDLLVGLVEQGYNIDEFVPHLEAGFHIEELISPTDNYGV